MGHGRADVKVGLEFVIIDNFRTSVKYLTVFLQPFKAIETIPIPIMADIASLVDRIESIAPEIE